MSTATDIGLAPTTHGELLAWVSEIVELTRPERVQWCDGSAAELT